MIVANTIGGGRLAIDPQQIIAVQEVEDQNGAGELIKGVVVFCFGGVNLSILDPNRLFLEAVVEAKQGYPVGDTI